MPVTSQNIAQLAGLIIQAKNKDKEIAQRQRESQAATGLANAALAEKMRQFDNPQPTPQMMNAQTIHGIPGATPANEIAALNGTVRQSHPATSAVYDPKPIKFVMPGETNVRLAYHNRIDGTYNVDGVSMPSLPQGAQIVSRDAFGNFSTGTDALGMGAGPGGGGENPSLFSNWWERLTGSGGGETAPTPQKVAGTGRTGTANGRKVYEGVDGAWYYDDGTPYQVK